MKVLRTALVAIGSAALLFTSSPASAAGIVIIEGESASSWTSGCGDGGDPVDMGPRNYGGRQTMFFPASGCSATYRTSAEVILSATFLTSGQAPTICGTITVSGTTTGSATFCGPNDTATTVNLTPPATSANGVYTVTWTTGANTASYCNLFLDFMVGVDAA